MNVRTPTEADLAYWAELNPRVVLFTAPEDPPDCIPVYGLITDTNLAQAQSVCRVALELDEIELMHLAKGGTIWLSTWGGLPVFMVEVQEPS